MKKNILIIQRDLGGGGAEKVLIDILNNFDYDKYNVTLLLIYKTGVYINDINKNVNVKAIYDPNKFKFRIMQSIYCRFKTFLYDNYPELLYKYWIDKDYDVEIAFLEGEATSFLSKSNNEKAKKIAWVHIDISKSNKNDLDKFKSYYEKIDNIVCVSNDSKIKFNECFPKYKEKSVVIYNLIDSKKIRKVSFNKIEKNIFNDNTPTLIGVGRLTKQKRFDVLIKAYKKLLDDGLKCKLVILGSGSEEENLRKLIKELKLEKKANLLGFIKNPYPYIKEADIFVMSSDYEGFSLVVAEAMSLGKAIVSTRCTGPTELLGDGKYGKIVSCDNPTELKDSIKSILKNKEEKQYYENKSIQRSKMFDVNSTMNEIYEILER